jgi:alpha-L-rhamnosidase
MKLFRRCLAIAIVLAPPMARPQSADAYGWITDPRAAGTPVVLHFRRTLSLDRLPTTLPVRVTADNRFVLFANGARVASGPSTGTIARWRETHIDLASHLRRGDNHLVAIVWNFGAAAPVHQQSVATGFRLVGGEVGTAKPGWRSCLDESRTATEGKLQIPWQYYVASAPEVIDATRRGCDDDSAAWLDAAPAPAAAARTLVADPLPGQLFSPADAGRVVRGTLPSGNFPTGPVTVPPRTAAKLLVRRDAMISAYPELDVAGGRGARITLEYGEALYDADDRKGDRDLVEDRRMRGFHDTFLADGASRTFAPLWWRTFRFVEIAVTTADEPLTLLALRLNETGFPFEERASFRSSDPELDRIWRIGWRTLRVDAHETFMDSSYWEQLQYTGDTRLQMLITYAVSGDPRLARQAIDAFAQSDVDGGFMQGAYPSRNDNVIATFAFAWIGMLADWSMEQPDASLVVAHLPRLRRVLERFGHDVNARGLVGKNRHWNFIDWSGQEWDDRNSFPSWGTDNGSCLMTAMWVGGLRQGAELERRHGDATRAATFAARADAARNAIRAHCWDAARGIFADDAERKVFSQHMNVFAVLYDIATRDEAAAILDRVTRPEGGIDAPAGMYSSTYYFAWYLARAFEHAGRPERYHALLRSWREMLPLNFTSWPELRHGPRSDTHAWSAHPTADLLGVVAGIRPAAPGYSRLRIAPVLGDLTSLEATAMTPRGPVGVRYRRENGRLLAEIDRPADLPGELIWKGKRHPLTRPTTRLTLPDR